MNRPFAPPLSPPPSCLRSIPGEDASCEVPEHATPGRALFPAGELPLRLAPEIHCLGPDAGSRPGSARIELLNRASGAQASLPGTALQAAVACQGLFLLLLRDDSSLGCRLHLQLVDATLRPLDGATLKAPLDGACAPGPLVLSHPDQIVFCYPARGAVWQVRLLPGFRLRVPGWSEAAGLRPGRSWRRHFTIRRID